MSAHAIRQAARPALVQVPRALNDSTNAANLVSTAGSSFRFIHDAKRFIVRDDDTNLWANDDTGAVVRYAQQAAGRWFDEAKAATDLELKKQLSRHAEKSANRAKLNDAIDLAKSEPGITISASDLDADPWLLSVRNGVVDLRSGDLRDRRPTDLMTKCIDARYRPEAECPAFEAFLFDVMADRWELVDFLQVIFGYALYGGNPEQALMVFVGTGANGKSTLLSVMQAIFGDYGKTTPAETFLQRPDGAPSNDLARLLGTRLVTATEAEANRRLAENLVKRLTGGDRIAARFLFAEFFEFVPAFLAFLAVNHRPIVSGDDPAIWRRLLIVPFDRVIPPERRDPTLVKKLLDERDAILGWMVRGCLKWQQAQRLVVPAASVAAATEYRETMDTLGNWIDERCVVVAGVSAQSGPLYDNYASWCDVNGHRPLASNKFSSKLLDRGFVKEKTSSANVYRGIALSSK